ncbi:P22AR C-terminal domain-containing protein, partial [Escherichia coli]|uniref:P22AR C-terminal domain-containing protein n=1 Tax=Escherichia coli TaxID=562 RepID=UPI003D810DCB
ANRSQALFRELYPALKLIQSGYSGICHDYGYEFSYIIGRARGVLINHTRDTTHGTMPVSGWHNPTAKQGCLFLLRKARWASSLVCQYFSRTG